MKPTALSRWLPVAVWAIVIFISSSIPDKAWPRADVIFSHDKLIHLGVYGTLGLCAMRGFAPRWWWALLAVAAFGATDEFHQLFTPGRSCDVFDWMADVCGGVLGVGAYFVLARWWRGRVKTAVHGDHP